MACPGLLLLFALFAGLMMTRRLPALLALPMLALSIGLLDGLNAGMNSAQLLDLLGNRILGDGSVGMARSMVVAFAGGCLGQVVLRQGIAGALVSRAAEYAGDRQMLLCLGMLLVVAINFSALSGVGAILMVGNLVLPIMIGAGVSPERAGVTMLFGIALGGLVNPLALQIYVDLLKVPLQVCLSFCVGYYLLLWLAALAFVLWGCRRPTFAWAAQPEPGVSSKLGMPALITPILPLILMGPARTPPLLAIATAIVYGCLISQPRRSVNNLTQALIEGIRDVAPMVALFVGLGMVLEAIQIPQTREILAPVLRWGIPHSGAGYILYFTLLAPLSTYRGPLTLYGLGAGLAALMVSELPVEAVLAAFLCLGQFQSICDPTCTHAVCVGQVVHQSPEKLAKIAAPYVWIFVASGLTWVVLWRGI
ncbi:MAG: hypothetical protein U0931_38940 [Vulcanimicrobiota bacterium]